MKAISAETKAPGGKAESVVQIRPEKNGKVIHLFGKNDPIATHPTKKAHSD
jgi:hypothetical protein